METAFFEDLVFIYVDFLNTLLCIDKGYGQRVLGENKCGVVARTQLKCNVIQALEVNGLLY